jgi:hypothetical protein
LVRPSFLCFEASILQCYLSGAAKEVLDDAVLLGRLGHDELLAQPMIAAGGAKTPALKT